MREACPSARLDEPMAPHTTFKIGGPADCYAEPQSREELSALLRVAREEKVPLLVIGWGSNLLVRDRGVRGLVVRLRGEFERLDFREGGLVWAGAGARVPQLVLQAAERGLGGDESLVGIPGTVGGALAMNAGTRDGEIGDLVVEVDLIDLATLELSARPRAAIDFSYRSSSLRNVVVLGGLLRLKAGDKADIMTRVQQYQQKRLQTQPVHTFNVGSTFKNPPGRFVAKLIEDAGLKGAVEGGARISPMHANFIENFSGGTADDVLKLVERARTAVRAAFGVELELEMKVVGDA